MDGFGRGAPRRDPEATWARFEALLRAEASSPEAREEMADALSAAAGPADAALSAACERSARDRRVAARLFDLREARRRSVA